jgi:hypothetical protein
MHRRRDADPREGLAKYGKTTFGDPVNKKYPIDTPGRIKAAWAYIHHPSNTGKYTAGELRTLKGRIRKAAKARKMVLPDPDEFVELIARLRKKNHYVWKELAQLAPAASRLAAAKKGLVHNLTSGASKDYGSRLLQNGEFQR